MGRTAGRSSAPLQSRRRLLLHQLRSRVTVFPPSTTAITVCCKLKNQRPSATFMDPHSIVVLSLHSPKEKIWGELLVISPAGITLRGVDLNSFDHFIRQINEPDGERVGVPTLFFPMTRVERVTLDEPAGSIPSMDELFARKVGRRLIDYLAQFA